MNTNPFNPSKKATARVKNPLPVPTKCNCCGECSVEITHHNKIYGKSYGDWPWVYLCKSCKAYVGVHPFTNIPLGTLANEETRKARKYCKEPFEALHRTGKLSRSDAYQKLAEKLGIDKEKCHFAWFDEATCYQAAKAAREIFFDL